MKIFYILIRSTTDDTQMCQFRGVASNWTDAGEKALQNAKENEHIENPYICELRDEGRRAF